MFLENVAHSSLNSMAVIGIKYYMFLLKKKKKILYVLIFQVLKLSEQLSEAQNEIRKLSERLAQETLTNSPSSPRSVEANGAPIHFEFPPDVNYNIPFYISDNSYLQNMEYWDGLYV